MKILLTQIMRDIKGKPMKTNVEGDDGEPVMESGKPKKRNMLVRDHLLIILSTKFKIKDKQKEPFWATDLGIACSKQDVLDVSGEQLEFLRRIVESNTITQRSPMGGEDKEVELFFPFELSQVMRALDGKGEQVEETEEKKEPVKVEEVKKA